MLSIITINYNNINGLQRTVESVLSQNYSGLDYIIIDGDSTDGGREYILQNRNIFSSFIIEKDFGIYDAMNKGLKLAKGDFILFLNSGDLLHVDSLQNLMAKFIGCSNVDIFLFDVLYKDDYNLKLRTYDFYDLCYLSNEMFNHQGLIYRSNCFDEFQFDTKLRFCADRKHLIQLILSGAEICHMKEILTIFDNTGVSSNPANSEFLKVENILVSEELLPKYLIDLCCELNDKRSKLDLLRRSRLWKLLNFCGLLRIF
jgi:glycosyltransferase involved in cell wall biosynthesis